MKKYIALAAACATALTPILSTPSIAAGVAAPANGDTTAAAQGACAADLAALQNSAGDWSIALVFGATPTATDPVEVGGTRAETAGTRAPDLTSAVLSFSDVTAAGASHLTRNGQSPNIFTLDAIARTVTYANSSFQFTAQYTTTTTFAYTCEMTQKVAHTVTVPAVPAGPVEGYYTNPGNGDCHGIDNTHEKWGQTFGACEFHKTGDGTPAVPSSTTTTYTFDRQPGSDTSHTTTQDDTAPGSGTELNGGQYTFSNQSLKVAAVVCNSPGKNPGSWKPQNGYLGLGGACSTATFTSLGTTTIPSNSLPAA